MHFRLHISFITFISIISLLRAKKLCDVRIWYLNIITDSVFNLDLTHEQLLLKDSIESLVLKASESKETRMVDCSILHVYNDMLQDVFSYKSSGSGMTLTEIETEEKQQSDDNTVSDLKSDGLKDDMVEETQTDYGAGNVHDEREQSDTTDSHIRTTLNTDEVQHEFKGVEIKDQDDTGIPVQTDSITETQVAYNKDDENYIDTEPKQDLGESFEKNMVKTQESENKDFEEKDIDESNYVKETDEVQTDEVYNLSNKITNEHLENNADNIDETEVLEDTGPLVAVSSSHTSGEASDSQQINEHTKEPSELEEIFVSNSIPFGVCWSFGCLMSDIFDVYSIKSEDYSDKQEYETAKTLSNRNRFKEKKKWHCPVGPFCTMKCFYIFLLSNSFCMKDSVLEEEVKEEHRMQKDDDHDEVITGRTREAFNPTTDFHKTRETLSTLTNIHSDFKTVKITALEQENKLTNKEIQNTMFDRGVNFNHPAAVNDKNKWNVKEFENLVEERTSKYFSKLQTIEVMIMKLENQLLMEALNKQNHSSTITKLENQILRLENELLKMNKNYQTLREESVTMSKRQNKYLELAYKKARNEYPKLTDNSNVRYELISKHQDKINELSEVLVNHSSMIKQFREKHEALEDQTRILQQMVMNQTLFMSSMMKTVHDLTEQNTRNQQEINSLKQKLEENLDKEKSINDENSKMKQDVIDQLENMVFNNREQKFHQKQNTEEFKFEGNNLLNSENPVVYDMNYPESRSSFTTVTKWCPRDNRTCPSCHYTTVVNSQCVPFQKIIWSKCEIEERAAESDFPPVPSVKDEQSDRTNDAESSDLKTIDDLETVTYNQESQGKQYKHFDTSPSADNYEISNDQENINDEDGKSMQNVSENEELKKYQLVGYDRDGKPVLKFRDDLKKDENLERKKDISSLKTEKQNDINENQIQSKDKGEVVANEDTTENKKMTETSAYSENDISKNVEESKENTEIKMQVWQKKQERSNINIEKGVKNDIENSNNGHESSLKEDGNHLSLKDTGQAEDKDSVKVPEHLLDEARKDISTSHKSILDGKSSEPPEEPQKNKVLPETKNDLNKVNKEESPRSDPSQKHTSESNVVGEKHEAVKNEQKTSIPRDKQKQRMIPINLDKSKQSEPKDCYDHYNRGERKDGLFKVKPLGSDRVTEVFCDMRHGGWTVIQRRQDGTINFFQDWNDYKKGFGGLYGEHWLGNDNIHLLTNQDYYKLRVDLMDWEKKKKYAEFDYFLVESEDQAYKLHVDGYRGDAGDGLTKHTGSMFSTKDVDNDKVVKEFGGSCAIRFYGAGWYFKCYASNLNGRFYKGGKIPEKRYDGITWKPWTGPNYSLKKVEMKIRPTSAG